MTQCFCGSCGSDCSTGRQYGDPHCAQCIPSSLCGWDADGPATIAHIDEPFGIDVDFEDNVVFADRRMHSLRKVSNATKIISLVAGTEAGMCTRCHPRAPPLSHPPCNQTELAPFATVTDSLCTTMLASCVPMVDSGVAQALGMALGATPLVAPTAWAPWRR